MVKECCSRSIPVINNSLKTELQKFQIEQLESNFRDLYSSPNYGELYKFFIEEIYAAKSVEERNISFEQITKYFKNSIGERFFHGLIRLLDVYTLSDRLDDKMVLQLESIGIGKK